MKNGRRRETNTEILGQNRPRTTAGKMLRGSRAGRGDLYLSLALLVPGRAEVGALGRAKSKGRCGVSGRRQQDLGLV